MRKTKRPVLGQERGRKVFCKYITKNGRRIYPRHANVFCFSV